MKNKLNYISIIILILISSSCKNENKTLSSKLKSNGEFDKSYYSEIGVCPYEGCAYGEWSTKDKIKMFKEPKLDSDIVGNIPAKRNFTALTGKIEVVPGIAYKIKDITTTGNTESETSKIEYNQPIYILHYVGEGFYKINQNNEFGFLELPTDEKTFNENKLFFNWVSIEKYPTEFKWWAEIEYLNLKGWILVSDKVVLLDKFG